MSFLLTQHEAEALLALGKHYQGMERFSFPSLGGALRIPLHSEDKREEFSLDVRRSSIQLLKNTFQARARKTIILARIDIGGSPHRNPDGEEIPCPHLHIYREEYGDKWATPLPKFFGNSADVGQVLDKFMAHCNIITKPIIQLELFT